MVEIKPSERGIDYNCALGDVKAFVDEKRERGWSDEHILDAIGAMGRAGVKQVNHIIEDLAARLEVIDPIRES